MAEVLFVRDLSERTNQALEWYRTYNNVSANSKAAIEMIESYQRLKQQNEEMRSRIDDLERILNRLVTNYQAKQEAEEQIKHLIKLCLKEGA